MIRKRLAYGSIMGALGLGLVGADGYLAPYYPVLFFVFMALGYGCGRELLGLIDSRHRPRAGFVLPALLILLACNWLAPLRVVTDVWTVLYAVVGAIFVGALLIEMLAFREPNGSIERVALTMFIIAYLGVLPSYLAQLRWLEGPASPLGLSRSTLAIAVAFFVPKFSDIVAYFTGHAIGRHRMTPLLSPKKTWEGAIGGLLGSIFAVLVIWALGLHLVGGWLEGVLLGLALGFVGIMGDLAESLMKREGQQKDAGGTVPGFGGILDVIDSILFTGPVVYWWLTIRG